MFCLTNVCVVLGVVESALFTSEDTFRAGFLQIPGHKPKV